MRYDISEFSPVYSTGGNRATKGNVEDLRAKLIEDLPKLEQAYEEKSKKYSLAIIIENQKNKNLKKIETELVNAARKDEIIKLKQKLITQKAELKQQKIITKRALENKKQAKQDLDKTKTAIRRPSRLADMIKTGRLDPTKY